MKIKIGKKDLDLEISKVTKIKLNHDKEFIYFDKLSDGTWRLCYTEGTYEHQKKD